MAKTKKPKFQKLSINLYRRGEVRFEIAYNARDAAQSAVKWAKQGWQATVQTWNSLGTKRGVQMTCMPKAGKARAVAACTIVPAFKKQLRGR